MRKQSSSLVGLVLLMLLVLGYVGLTRQQRVVTSEQAATVTATETAGCLRQTHDCVTAAIAPPPTSTPTMTATAAATATQPESPLPTPTRTPWAPPPPPVATPTTIPLVVPQDNRGTLYYAADTTSSTTLYALETDATGHPISAPTPVPLDRYGPIDELFASPDGRYLVTSYDTLAQVLEIFDRRSGALVSTLTPQLFYGWHPDSQHVLVRYSAQSTFGSGLGQANITTDERLPLVLQQGENPFWRVNGAVFSPSGQKLTYATNSGIWIANQNGSTPVKILDADDVWAWSFDGQYLLYSGEPYKLPKGDISPRYALWIWDRHSQQRIPIRGPYFYGFGFTPLLSPATQEVAFVGVVDPGDCFFIDAARRADPLCKVRGFSLFVGNLASGEVERIADNVGQIAWSPDGSAIAYTQLDEQGQLDLWISYLADGQHMQLTDTAATEQAVLWLPE